VCFSPDGSKLASGSYDYSIKIWDLKTNSIEANLEGHEKCVYSVCFSPDGSKLASGSDD
jgi:WD40 repeat protein